MCGEGVLKSSELDEVSGLRVGVLKSCELDEEMVLRVSFAKLNSGELSAYRSSKGGESGGIWVGKPEESMDSGQLADSLNRENSSSESVEVVDVGEFGFGLLGLLEDWSE